MLFSGRAAATKANILFDTGASGNFVSANFAKQTGISISPTAQTVRLANDAVVDEILGEATVYVQLGAFHKPVKCFVMNLLFEVDLILGDEFMSKYNCILHYGRNCIMIQKGKRHMTVNSPALPRSAGVVEEEKTSDPSLLTYSQMKRLARKGAAVFLATLKPMDDARVSPSARCSSVGEEPVSSVQPDQPREPPDNVSSEPKWVSELCLSFLTCFRILFRLVCLPSVRKGTVFLQSQVTRRRFGRCTVYLHWNIVSWKNRLLRF